MEKVKVIYKDEQVVVAYKPSGILSQGTCNNEQNILDTLQQELSCTMYPVHRLDRLTSGVMIFARDTVAAAELCELFAQKRVTKKYLAVVSGNTPDCDVLECNMFFDRQKNKSFVVKEGKKSGKSAVLEFKTIKRGEYNGMPCSMVEVYPKTGRTHQIRLQLSNAGYPIFGDGKYGSKINGCTCTLHCAEMTIDSDLLTNKLESFKNALFYNSNLIACKPDVAKFPWNIFEL